MFSDILAPLAEDDWPLISLLALKFNTVNITNISGMISVNCNFSFALINLLQRAAAFAEPVA